MSAAATAAGYLYASGRIGRKAREERERALEQPPTKIVYLPPGVSLRDARRILRAKAAPK